MDVDAYRVLSDGAARPALDEPAGVTVHGLESGMGFLSCLATQQLGRPLVHGRAIARLLDRGFDVIHYHNISLVGGPGVLALGDALKLYTAHEHWLVCPSHILWRHNREVCDGRECLRCVLNHRRPPQLWRATTGWRRHCDHVDAFLTPSQFCADKHREFGFEREMTVMPLFLPDEAESVAEPAAEAGSPYYLFVGRLNLFKGLQDVIPQFTGTEGPELWVAGSGPDEAALKAQAEGLPRVRFLGRLAPEALRGLYRGAIAVVMPSRCYEVFPMVFVEAFREGTPVIARRLGPFPEIIEQSGAGLLFGDEAELSQALRQMAEDRPLRDRLGVAGRRAFAANWSEEVAVGKYLSLIRRVARDGGRKQLADRLSGLTEAENVV